MLAGAIEPITSPTLSSSFNTMSPYNSYSRDFHSKYRLIISSLESRVLQKHVALQKDLLDVYYCSNDSSSNIQISCNADILTFCYINNISLSDLTSCNYHIEDIYLDWI